MSFSPANLHTRARLVAALRKFFKKRDYLEVETPCRIPAPLPEANITPQPAGDWYLQTSPEVCMKRLLSAELPRLFQICRSFRKNERGRRHLPEFTLLEWYGTERDYFDLMEETEALVRFAAARLQCGYRLIYQGRTIDLSPGWPKLSVAEAFESHATRPLDQALADGSFDEEMGLHIEPALGAPRPVFLYDYPAAAGAAFARRKDADQTLVERFELYIAGLELANGFSELTGADHYRRRFTREQNRLRATGRPAAPMPEKFLADIQQMPPSAGNALGVDRLAMLFCDTPDIDDVVAFSPESL